MLFIGSRDMSHDLGVPGEDAAQVFVDAVGQVLAAPTGTGRPPARVNDGTAAASLLEQGFSFVAIGSDLTHVGRGHPPRTHVSAILKAKPT